MGVNFLNVYQGDQKNCSMPLETLGFVRPLLRD